MKTFLNKKMDKVVKSFTNRKKKYKTKNIEYSPLRDIIYILDVRNEISTFFYYFYTKKIEFY